jgi:hypothetical protein
MDSTLLRLAYKDLLETAETVADAGAGSDPPPGEWDAKQLLAHLVSVDAGILAVGWSIVAGGQASFDNRLSLDTWNLGRIEHRIGDQVRLRQRIRVQGEALCDLAEQLGEDELDQAIPTLLLSRDTLLVDAPLALRSLISGLADDHLPRHTLQLRALLPPDPVPAT